MMKQFIKYLLKDKKNSIQFMINLILFATMLFIPSVASAEEPYTSALTSVLHYSGEPFVDEYNFCETNGCTASVSLGGASATCSTDFGTNRVYVFSDQNSYFLESYSTWLDEFVINGSTGTDNVIFNISLTGNLNGDSSNYDYSLTGWPSSSYPSGGDDLIVINGSGTSSIDQSISRTYTFTYDMPFIVDSSLIVTLEFLEGYADFSKSAILTSIILPPGASITSTSGTQYTVDFKPTNSKDLELEGGWSLISIPLIPENASLSSLFPDALVVYGFQDDIGYIRIKGNENIDVGRGYWIFLNQGKTYTLFGQPFSDFNLPINEAGWFIIGGCTSDSKVSSTNCNIGVIYKFEKELGYKRVLQSEKLQPGKGYWILVNNVMDQAKLIVETI